MIKDYKVPQHFKKLEQSHRSINTLEKKIIEYFDNVNSTFDIYFPDTHNLVYKKKSNQTNVVFMGGFLKRVFEIQNWHFKEITIWVMCQNSKKFFVEVLGFSSESISIIPRSIFQSEKNPTRNTLDYNRTIHLIYSGRFSQQKNFDVLLDVYKELENSTDYRFKLICIGGYDNSFHEQWGEFNFFDFKVLCENHIESIAWKNSPLFIDWLPTDQWTDAVPSNSLLISLSTYICEDFGLSVQQAQEFGLQAILTDWGGHSDATINNVLLINPAQIPTIYDHPNLRDLKVKCIANKILLGLQKIPYTTINSTEPENANNSTSLVEYKKQIDDFQRSLWSDNLLVQKYGLPRFADTLTGVHFFQKYFNTYSGNKFSCDDIYFINDLNSNAELSTLCLNNIFEFKKCNDISVDAVFLPTKDFDNPIYSKSLHKAQRYIFTYFNIVHIKIFICLLKTNSGQKKEYYVPKHTRHELEIFNEIQIFYY